MRIRSVYQHGSALDRLHIPCGVGCLIIHTSVTLLVGAVGTDAGGDVNIVMA